jgi:hypothetical protein
VSPGERESKAQTRYALVIGLMHVHDAQFGNSETGDCKLDTPNTVISGEGVRCSQSKRARPGLTRRLTLFWLGERHCGDAMRSRDNLEDNFLYAY